MYLIKFFSASPLCDSHKVELISCLINHGDKHGYIAITTSEYDAVQLLGSLRTNAQLIVDKEVASGEIDPFQILKQQKNKSSIISKCIPMQRYEHEIKKYDSQGIYHPCECSKMDIQDILNYKYQSIINFKSPKGDHSCINWRLCMSKDMLNMHIIEESSDHGCINSEVKDWIWASIGNICAEMTKKSNIEEGVSPLRHVIAQAIATKESIDEIKQSTRDKYIGSRKEKDSSGRTSRLLIAKISDYNIGLLCELITFVTNSIIQLTMKFVTSHVIGNQVIERTVLNNLICSELNNPSTDLGRVLTLSRLRASDLKDIYKNNTLEIQNKISEDILTSAQLPIDPFKILGIHDGMISLNAKSLLLQHKLGCSSPILGFSSLKYKTICQDKNKQKKYIECCSSNPVFVAAGASEVMGLTLNHLSEDELKSLLF